MKKKIALLLAVMMIVAMFATVLTACNDTKLSDDSLKSLLSELTRYHRSDPTNTPKDYTLIGKISTITDDGEVEAYVSWTSSTDKVAISNEMNSANFYTVTVPDSAARGAMTDDLSYTITGILTNEKGKAYTNEDGDNYSVTFDRKVTKISSYAMITFDSASKATTGDLYTDSYGNQGYETVLWEENDISVNAVRGNSTTGSATYTNSARFYSQSTMEISYTAPIKAIRINLDDYQNGKYLVGFDNMNVDGATIQRSGNTVLIVLATPTTTFVTAPLAGQTRIYSLEVYTAAAQIPTLEPEEEITPNEPTGFTAITAPVAGTYKMALWQANLDGGKYLYMTGEMDTYYFATTDDPASAIDIVLEASGSGWTMKVSGTDKYVRLYLRSGSTEADPSSSLEFSTTACVWMWNSELQAFYVTLGTTNFYLGTYNKLTTFSGSKESYFTQANPNFLAKLGTIAE